VSRKLPPLNALRAFEAAARHLSFTKAAEELHVTPAAISHQIKGLEAYFGTPLFRRRNRSLLLTDAGQLCLPGLTDGFDALADAVRTVDTRRESGPLSVSTTPSLAGQWLVPRLERFHQAHPDIDVRLHAGIELVDLSEGDMDLAVRFGCGDYPGLHVTRLFGVNYAPICSPALLENAAPLAKPEDLRHHTLLHDVWHQENDTSADWRMWLTAARVEDVDASAGPRYSDTNLTIAAAVAGQGVALVADVLITGDLRAGRLVKPFEVSLNTDCAYYIVSTPQAAKQPQVKAFRDWLVAEADA
jgi:LysR family glycine cleavage system transcriptional activator